MGGSSSQIVFLNPVQAKKSFRFSKKSKAKGVVTLNENMKNYLGSDSVYSRSFLGLGNNQFKNKLNETLHDCYDNASLSGSDRYDKCLEDMKTMANKTDNTDDATTY